MSRFPQSFFDLAPRRNGKESRSDKTQTNACYPDSYADKGLFSLEMQRALLSQALRLPEKAVYQFPKKNQTNFSHIDGYALVPSLEGVQYLSGAVVAKESELYIRTMRSLVYALKHTRPMQYKAVGFLSDATITLEEDVEMKTLREKRSHGRKGLFIEVPVQFGQRYAGYFWEDVEEGMLSHSRITSHREVPLGSIDLIAMTIATPHRFSSNEDLSAIATGSCFVLNLPKTTLKEEPEVFFPHFRMEQEALIFDTIPRDRLSKRKGDLESSTISSSGYVTCFED